MTSAHRTRVLFVNHTLDLTLGGAEGVLHTLLEHLPRDRFEIEIATPAEADVPVPLAVQDHPLPALHTPTSRTLRTALSTILSLARLNLAVLRLLRRTRPEALYVNSVFALHFCGLPAALCGTPLVYHEHGLVSQRHGSPWHRLFPALARRARIIVAISEAVAEELRQCQFEPSRIRVVHNGIPQRDEAPAVSRARAPGSTLRVAQIANFHRWKGHPTAIEAVACAAAQGLDVRLALFGRPVDEDFFQDLLQQVQGLGVSDRVDFLDFVPDAESHLGDYDCMLLASDAEPFGLVLLEAMRAGTVVVATAAGGAVDIIEDDQSGLLFEPGDAENLVRCWRRLIEEPETADRLAKNAYHRFNEHFTAEHQAARVASVLWEASHG